MIQRILAPVVALANVLNRSAMEADKAVADYATVWATEREAELALRYDAAMKRCKPEKLAAFRAAVAARESSD